MLYKKITPKLDMNLFKNPTAEYRGAPFWGWNCNLKFEELEKQLEVLKIMGFGGAHLHVRTGMTIAYLGDQFMELIKKCVYKAKETDMLIWLYDEDRWPSGAAGGFVTKEIKYRAQHLLFTPYPYGSVKNNVSEKRVLSTVKAVRTENGKLLTCFDIHLNSDGKLIEWRQINEEEDARYEKWYAYVERNRESPWYNNQDYINVLNKEAVDCFINTTHNRYFDVVGEEFNKTIPAIFTDEPQLPKKTTLKYATEKEDIMLPWIDDLVDTFQAFYKEDLLKNLPELIWERIDNLPSTIRYHYHDHICERFTQAYMDNLGSWCSKHSIAFTGHMLGEESLKAQTYVLGDVMRCSRKLELPGIDMLCANFEYTTAKQTQSIVHQYNKEGMLSELYGVTNWDLDFRGHKLHGDWQAALGVTIRVHNLAMVSLKGEAKRDYPGSINYQASWWRKYSMVEDHFARLNTVLTRGKPIV